MSKITWTPKTGDGPFTAWNGTHLLAAYGRNAVVLKPDASGVWHIVARAKGADGKVAAEQALENLTRPVPPRAPKPSLAERNAAAAAARQTPTT